MGTIQFSPSAPAIQGPTPQTDFSVSTLFTSFTEPGATVETVQVGDVMLTKTTPGDYVETVEITVTPGAQCPTPSVVSTTPAVCIIGGSGEIQPLGTGFCSIDIQGPSGVRRVTEFVRKTPGIPEFTNPSQPVAGSLRRYLLDQQAAALSGVTPGSDSQRGSVGRNPWQVGGFGGVNPNNFLRAQGRPGMSPYPLDALDQILSSGTSWKAWISPHHFLTWRSHGSPSGPTWVAIGAEIIVEYSATPWNGTLCKLLPPDVHRWLPTVQAVGWYLPCWARLWHTYIGADNDVNAERGWVQPGNHGGTNPLPADDFRRPYQKVGTGTPSPMLNSGDSGSPLFTCINGQLVPIGHVAYQGIFGSWPYHNYRTEIDAAMASLNASGLFAAQTVDLSGFSTF